MWTTNKYDIFNNMKKLYNDFVPSDFLCLWTRGLSYLQTASKETLN